MILDESGQTVREKLRVSNARLCHPDPLAAGVRPGPAAPFGVYSIKVWRGHRLVTHLRWTECQLEIPSRREVVDVR